MKKQLMLKIKESLSSVLPITVIVLILSFTITPMEPGTLLLFILGAVLLILGMGFFSLGADIAMMPMGDEIGGQLAKTKKVSVMLVICFLIAVFITIAEPDLQVLADQVPAVADSVIIWTVAIGVGVFLMISVLRTLFKIPLSYMLVGLYILVFIMSYFVPSEFLAVAFDSGGVTTGPITVPFIMALGIGIASMRSDKEAENDSFGLVALCSVGPIIAIMILGMCYQSTEINYQPVEISSIYTSKEVAVEFAKGFPHYIKEVALGLTPILAFFLLFQIFSLHLSKKKIIKILVGIVYTFIGLVLFLTGVNIGFMPVGNFLGKEIASLSYNWVIIPIGMVVGYFIVAAEPAVHVLNKQVEEITNGAIPSKAMSLSLSIGVAVAAGISMLRVLTGISIMWFLIPGYLIALSLTFVVPKIFTAIAFDSGGVASGPMTATFLLPFAMGACDQMGGNVLTDAFGVVAMVAMTPLIAIQILGLVYQWKLKHKTDFKPFEEELLTDEIIDYDEEGFLDE